MAGLVKGIWILDSLCVLAVAPFTSPAEDYTEITVELNSTWQSLSLTSHRRATATCIVGTNTWFFSGDFLKNAKVEYWLVGTNIVEQRTITSSMYLEQAKEFVSEKVLGQNPRPWVPHSYPGAGQTFTTVHPAPLGKPVFFGMEGVIWIAFCSGDYLRHAGRQIPMPIGPSSQGFGYSDQTVLFDQHCGLPNSVKLFATNGTRVCDYEVLAATNYLGRMFPVQFRVMQQGQPANGMVMLGSTTHLEGRVTSIKPGKWPGLPGDVRKKLGQ